jgi:hypothetical protein
MKQLKEFKEDPIFEQEKSDYSRFDSLVRAGLADKSQLQRLHKILNKMQEDRPQFNNSDRILLQNLFNKMVDLLSNNKQIFQKTKQAVREETEINEGILDTSDFKVSKSGRKYRAHRIKVGDSATQNNEGILDTSDFKVSKSGRKYRAHRIKVGDSATQNTEITEALSQGEPPFVLVLKRKAYRMYPNNLRVALYYNDRLDKYFSVPYISDSKDKTNSAIQAEEYTLEESVMDHIHKIAAGEHPTNRVKFASGETRKVDRYTASAISQVHKALNDDNKKKLSDMVHKSPAHLMKVADFAFSKSK